MKVQQNKTESKFEPITVTFETDEEVVAFMALIGSFTDEEAEKEISSYDFHFNRVRAGVAFTLITDLYRELDDIVQL